MKSITRVFLMITTVAIVCGCQNVESKKTKGGMPYKLYPSKSGKKVEVGSFIKMSLVQKLDDSVLYDSHTKAPIYFQVSAESRPYDITEIMTTLKQGDSVSAVQMMDTFIARNPGNPDPRMKKGSRITTSFKVLDIFKTAEESKADEDKERELSFNNDPKIKAQLEKDSKEINAYLSKNNISAQKVGHGTFVQSIAPGDGMPVEKGKYVSLKYKGVTLAGVVFDTNMDTTFHHTEPLNFVLGGTPMMKGFEEGLLNLKKGNKVKLFIPSSLAYGEQPPTPDIKPNENLVFDIEVLDVQDKMPEMPNPQMNMDTTKKAPKKKN